MDIIVKDLGSVEEKSAAQKEEEVLNKVSEVNEADETKEPTVDSVVDSTPTEQSSEEAPVDTLKENIKTPVPELNEEQVLDFIKNRYDKDVSSVEDLLAKKEANMEMPEDVSAYLEYRKKTGRGFEDYVKLNRNFKEMDETQLLREYYSATEEDLDAEDIQYMMEDFSYDNELDEENVVKKKKLAFKKEIGKARKFFEQQIS